MTKIVKIISKNKRNKKTMIRENGIPTRRWYEPLFQAKIGRAECIVEEAGVLVTRHVELPKPESILA